MHLPTAGYRLLHKPLRTQHSHTPSVLGGHLPSGLDLLSSSIRWALHAWELKALIAHPAQSGPSVQGLGFEAR